MEATMIELRKDALEFSFPEVHPHARMRIGFQRTLRIPDDGKDYPLPAGLGRFPVRHVDDHADRVPGEWIRRGGVMLPMYQAEALWLNFESPRRYPFAVKVAAGKINAVTGDPWEEGLGREPQDYMVVPEQPWIDGYCVEEGVIRQFVAMPLGDGYSAEEQITGKGEHGGLQVVAYPMKAEAYQRLIEERRRVRESALHSRFRHYSIETSPDMGLAPGGPIRQEIYDDPYDLADWNRSASSRCFVHLTNALVWRAITGEDPPTTPPTSREYRKAGYPWFDYYAADQEAREGSETLSKLKSVVEKAAAEGGAPLPENESVEPERVIALRAELTEDQVREGRF
jgi:hypothetical protein